MRAVVARVLRASVRVDDQPVAEIGAGLLALVGVARDDGPDEVASMARKLHTLRVLPEETSLADVDAELLVVSQFTLYGDTRKGRRPSWNAAATADAAAPMIDELVAVLRGRGVRVLTGVFGARMQVESVNDGPFTVLVET